MATKIVQTFCQHCHMGCPVSAKVQDGKITSIIGYSCEKGKYGMEPVYHPDRLRNPLKRKAGRGRGKWKQISWDEALDIMTDRFGQIKKKYGPESIATVWACGHKLMATVATFLFSRVMGTPQIMDINYLCSYPGVIASQVTVGIDIAGDIGPSYRDSKCIILWGANLKHCRPAQEKALNHARAKGAKLIVIDPRPPQEVVTERAGFNPALWLRVRPGTDAALALGMINLMIKEDIYDRNFVDRWCMGFDELKRRAEEYPLDRVAEITWIPKEKIIKATRLFASTKPACLHYRLGLDAMQINSTQSARAVINLLVLAGNIDVPGGNLLPDALGGFIASRWLTGTTMGPLPPDVEQKRCGFKGFPMIAGSSQAVKDFPALGFAHNPQAIKAMLNGKIKALYIPGSNMMVGECDSYQTQRALKNLDFLVVADLFMTPTAELADLVLPAAHFLETEIPMRAFQRMGPAETNYILAPSKVIAPIGECWDDRKIVLELAKRMKVDIAWKSIEDLNDWQLQKTGLKYENILKKRNQMISFGIRYKKYDDRGFRFNTPSGKVELYSNILKNNGYDPLPSYEEPPQSPFSKPEIVKDYPLTLTNYRHIAYIHSEFRQISSLRKKKPDFTLDINPETANERGIKEGDQVFIERPGFERRVGAKARFIPELHPNIVACMTHWWFPERSGPDYGCFEANINTITSTEPPYDPINGNPQARAIPCRVTKAK